MGGLIRAMMTIFLSLILGAIAVALCALYFPETLLTIQIQASGVKEDILYSLKNHFGTTPNVEVWLRFLLQEQSLVFMGFVIVARLAVWSLLSLIGWIFSSVFSVDEQDEHGEILDRIAAERKTLAKERREIETLRKSAERIAEQAEAAASRGAAKAAQ